MLETPQIHRTGNNNYAASYGSDKNLFVEFYQDAILNSFKSEETGHPVYDEVDMINIMTVGNKTTFKNKVKMVSDANGLSDPERFPAQWAAYKAQKEQLPDGMPLAEWPAITKAHALNLRGLKVFTVEQLAEIPDNNIDFLGLGGRTLRDKAKAWLARSIDTGEISRLIARIDALETDNKMLKEQLKEKNQPEETPRAEKLSLRKG